MRIFLVDPALRDEKGHYLSYVESLADGFRSYGATTIIAGNRVLSSPACERLGVEPAFTFGHPHQDRELSPLALLPTWWRMRLQGGRRLAGLIPSAKLRRSLRFALAQGVHDRAAEQDLNDLFRRFHIDAKDMLVINSVDHRHIPGFIRSLKSLDPKNAPVSVFILHFSVAMLYPVPQRAREYLQHAFISARTSSIREKITLVADSTELASEYSELSGLPVTLVPIPHAAAFARDRPYEGEFPLRIAYLGVGTAVKGFHLLPPIVRELHSDIQARRMAFDVQVQLLDRSPSVHRALDELSTLPVTLHNGTLSAEAYRDLMDRSHILLQPFDRRYYGRQTSGVFAEARAAGLVPIVPSETTMAREVQRSGGGIVIDGTEAVDYADALRSLIGNFGRLAAEAAQAARNWRQLHSSEAFIACLRNLQLLQS